MGRKKKPMIIELDDDLKIRTPFHRPTQTHLRKNPNIFTEDELDELLDEE
jgi:hypothetical protein